MARRCRWCVRKDPMRIKQARSRERRLVVSVAWGVLWMLRCSRPPDESSSSVSHMMLVALQLWIYDEIGQERKTERWLPVLRKKLTIAQTCTLAVHLRTAQYVAFVTRCYFVYCDALLYARANKEKFAVLWWCCSSTRLSLSDWI